MPQVDISTYLNIIFWLFSGFFGFYLSLSLYVLFSLVNHIKVKFKVYNYILNLINYWF